MYSMLDVSATMLITLYARARETMSKNPVIFDEKAVEMINIIKKRFHNQIIQSTKKSSRINTTQCLQFHWLFVAGDSTSM